MTNQIFAEKIDPKTAPESCSWCDEMPSYKVTEKYKGLMRIETHNEFACSCHMNLYHPELQLEADKDAAMLADYEAGDYFSTASDAAEHLTSLHF